jgi:hypothetical protein
LLRNLNRGGQGLILAVAPLDGWKLDVVGVQEVRWEKGGSEQAKHYTFFNGEGNEDDQLGTGFSYIREPYQQLGE